MLLVLCVYSNPCAARPLCVYRNSCAARPICVYSNSCAGSIVYTVTS